MALVTALQFTKYSGAICVDQESWHLLRRKTFFSDCIYSVVPEDVADRFGIDLIYAGVGHPSYHLEVANKSENLIGTIYRALAEQKSTGKDAQVTVKDMAEIVLECFSNVHRRRISDKLKYLYGFTAGEFVERTVTGSNDQDKTPINQEQVIGYTRNILEGKESGGYPPLSPAIEACIIGVDRVYGFSGFTIKEQDGVLSFHSCGFDSLGCGRYVAAADFAKLFNGKFLDSRRTGVGKAHGLYHILNAMIEAIDHSGQVGGNVRLVMIDAAGKSQKDRISVLSHNPARLSLEIMRAARNGLVTRAKAREYLVRLMDKPRDWEHVEEEFFTVSTCPDKLEKLLRGYKINENDLPVNTVPADLFTKKKSGRTAKNKKRVQK